MSKEGDLIYVGGGRYLNGIPATDLTPHEIEVRQLKRADLLASGLWIEQPKEVKPPKGKE